MKPRIEKKLSKKLHAILGNQLGEVWIDNELELHQPHWRWRNGDDRPPLTGKQQRQNWQQRVSVNHMPSIGGGVDYWGEWQDWHSVLHVAKDALPWRFGEKTDPDGPRGGWPLLKAKMTSIWVIKHAKIYAMQEHAKAIKKARDDALVKDLRDSGAIWMVPKRGWCAPCVACEKESTIECDLSDFVPEFHWCGGSPRCCP